MKKLSLKDKSKTKGVDSMVTEKNSLEQMVRVTKHL